MTWTQHTPYRQPGNWRAITRRILARDQRRCHVCAKPGATQVDHLTPVSQGGTHADSNLAAIHERCHQRKTQREANAARLAALAAAKAKNTRAPEPHPGLL